jgi:hypothetical protein
MSLRLGATLVLVQLAAFDAASAETAIDRIENSLFDRAIVACGSAFERAKAAAQNGDNRAQGKAEKRLADCMTAFGACFYWGTVPDSPELDERWQCRTQREPDNDRFLARSRSAEFVCRQQALRVTDTAEQDRRFEMCWAGWRRNLDIRFEWRQPKPAG